jgi:PPOX class probable F420-dependent enzyme
MEDLQAKTAEARVARMATVDFEGRPHLVPLCFVLEGDMLYSAVDEKPKRSKALKRLENIRAHSRVTVLVDHYEDDWSRLWWVRLDGNARILESGREYDRALALLLEKYDQYRAEPPRGPVIAITVERRLAWSAGAHAAEQEGAQ